MARQRSAPRFTSPALMGHVVQMKGSVVTSRRGKDGQPIRFTNDPLITKERWDELQQAISRSSKARGEAQAAHVLYNVAFCRKCSTDGNPVKLYGSRRIKSQHKGNYYHCKACGLHIAMAMLEGWLESEMLRRAGSRVLPERRIIPGDDHAADIARLERAAERRRELLTDAPDDDDLARSLAVTEKQIAELRNQPHEADRLEWTEAASGITVAEHWESLDSAERAKFLRDFEVTCHADRIGAALRLGWLEIDNEVFRLHGNRLAPTALPVLISHSREWQSIPGAVLPARVVGQS